MRYNGTFRFSTIGEIQRDPCTGFYSDGGSEVWLDGGECQIDKSIPAKQVIGSDGQMVQYSYDLFIRKPFRKGELAIGTKIQITSEEGVTDEFVVQGVDDMNRKYIELWG